MTDLATIPVFIVCRDRLLGLKELLNWLTWVGQKNIILVDNASSYPPLLRFFSRCQFEVLRAGSNYGSRVVWELDLVRKFADKRPYIVTDPDVVPIKSCPRDAIRHFHFLLKRYPSVTKVGFGLKINDLPDCYEHKMQVKRWEAQFWKKEIKPGVFRAPLDTTFALYRPQSSFGFDALRTGAPYVARHLPWYLNSQRLTAEERYYRKHLRKDVSNWNQENLPLWLQGLIQKQPQL
jgi:hypothetical protein